jgi:F0F1-type ATP synthase assembly protein I
MLIRMRPWLAALSLSGIGFYIAGSIILCTIGGHWLDTKFGTGPLWFIVGLILGIVVAGYGTYSMLKPFMESGGKEKGSK